MFACDALDAFTPDRPDRLGVRDGLVGLPAGSADPAEADRRIAEGRLRIEGDPSRMTAVLRQPGIHRLLAAHTT